MWSGAETKQLFYIRTTERLWATCSVLLFVQTNIKQLKVSYHNVTQSIASLESFLSNNVVPHINVSLLKVAPNDFEAAGCPLMLLNGSQELYLSDPLIDPLPEVEVEFLAITPVLLECKTRGGTKTYVFFARCPQNKGEGRRERRGISVAKPLLVDQEFLTRTPLLEPP